MDEHSLLVMYKRGQLKVGTVIKLANDPDVPIEIRGEFRRIKEVQNVAGTVAISVYYVPKSGRTKFARFVATAKHIDFVKVDESKEFTTMHGKRRVVENTKDSNEEKIKKAIQGEGSTPRVKASPIVLDEDQVLDDLLGEE